MKTKKIEAVGYETRADGSAFLSSYVECDHVHDGVAQALTEWREQWPEMAWPRRVAGRVYDGHDDPNGEIGHAYFRFDSDTASCIVVF